MGVEQPECHDVVLLFGLLEVRARIVVDLSNSRIVVRFLGMKLSAERKNQRVDVDCVDVLETRP